MSAISDSLKLPPSNVLLKALENDRAVNKLGKEILSRVAQTCGDIHQEKIPENLTALNLQYPLRRLLTFALVNQATILVGKPKNPWRNPATISQSEISSQMKEISLSTNVSESSTSQ